MGALCCLAAWDARRAKIFDRCAPNDGIEPFGALVEQFISQAPYLPTRATVEALGIRIALIDLIRPRVRPVDSCGQPCRRMAGCLSLMV